MNLTLIGEHTINTDLLSPGGWVLDAGARDFVFAKTLAERGMKVLALDADPTVKDPHIPNVLFKNVALSATPGTFNFVMSSDPQARHIGSAKEGFPIVSVEAMTIEMVMRKVAVKKWDVVKLDIEGAEYDLLKAWSGPIATQLSIEFHQHCTPKSESVYDEIFYHLRTYYDVIQDVVEPRHGCVPNRWDTLLVAR